jgi:hypothetical protein
MRSSPEVPEPKDPMPEAGPASAQPSLAGLEHWEQWEQEGGRIAPQTKPKRARKAAARQPAEVPAEPVPPTEVKTPALPGLFTVEDIQSRLAREAELLDASRGGSHKFNNIRRFNSPSGANWTANFGVRGNNVRLQDAISLNYMQDVLLRVQAEMPNIRFDR